ncbi:hypothetical protein K474DRAFT_1710824 [Panus rudis PR-1116 ss-1]|nr:hypothetical protein K474DRAFT_1710824 [Panus rudis PR-1116 ss-1]
MSSSYISDQSNLTMAMATEEARALKAAVGALLVSGVDDGMKMEIQQLADYVEQISGSMNGVFKLMRETLENTTGELHEKLDAAFQNWIGIATNFVDTVLLSSSVANDALTTADDFIQTVLPMLVDDSKSIDEKKQLANSFLDTLGSREGQAQKMSQGFTDVSNNVKGFLVDLRIILSGYDVDDLEKRVEELGGLISKLLDDLKSLTSTLDTLNQQLVTAQSAERACGILGFLCPLWWTSTAINASQVESLKAQFQAVKDSYNSKLSDYLSKEEERRALQANLQGIPLLRTTTDKAEPDINSVIFKVGAIATCWAAIRADTQAMLEKLSFATDTESMALFKLRVKSAGELYKALQAALTDYKEYVDGSVGSTLETILQSCARYSRA